ncbi:MAG: GAF domain-containing protein [Candidatus Tectomicrobia bacterium]|nr:GAF domain-containing protein [Candidatus Tectomicrobia bacterium]
MTNLERDLSSLITLVSNVTDAYSACLFLENRRRKAFQLTSYHSLSPHLLAEATVESGQGFLGWVLENNEALSVNEFDKDTVVLGYYAHNEDIKSFMAAPLPSSLTKGALAIDSKKSWCFTAKSQKILAGFAQQFAYLVDGALAAVQMERRSIDAGAYSGYLASLHSCESEDQLLNAICLVPRELLPFDACFLVLRDEEAGTPRLARTSGFGELFLSGLAVNERASVAGYVLKKGEPLRLPDLRGPSGSRPLFHPDEPNIGARSALAVPLAAGGEVFGALGFTSRRRGEFDLTSLMRAEVAAAPAAEAILRLRAERRLSRQAEIDPLTGGRSMAHLRARLGEILRDAGLRGRRAALLCIAPDGLEGELHPSAGEEAAFHIHRLLAPAAQGGDILARHEGARFFLLLQSSSHEHAEAAAERLIQVINETPCRIGGRTAEVTASAGVACFPEHARDPQALIAASLGALAAARLAGINQLCFHGGG